MITLTRIRQNTPFILNPDLIERVDTHVDTVVRLTSGTEYVVNETGEEIVRRTAEFRARVLALAGAMAIHMHHDAPVEVHTSPTGTHPTEVWAPALEAPSSSGTAPTAPVEAVAVDETPVDETPVDETPVDETPVDETPVDTEEIAS